MNVPEFFKGVVGVTEEEGVKYVVMETGDGAYMQATPEAWVKALRESNAIALERWGFELRINAREPERWVEEATTELSKRGNEADALKSDSAAGKIMWGQAQAYRDAAALIRSYVKP